MNEVEATARALTMIDAHTEIGAFARVGTLLIEARARGDHRDAAKWIAVAGALRRLTTTV